MKAPRTEVCRHSDSVLVIHTEHTECPLCKLNRSDIRAAVEDIESGLRDIESGLRDLGSALP